jgi:hypothetical protein
MALGYPGTSSCHPKAAFLLGLVEGEVTPVDIYGFRRLFIACHSLPQRYHKKAPLCLPPTFRRFPSIDTIPTLQTSQPAGPQSSRLRRSTAPARALASALHSDHVLYCSLAHLPAPQVSPYTQRTPKQRLPNSTIRSGIVLSMPCHTNKASLPIMYGCY